MKGYPAGAEIAVDCSLFGQSSRAITEVSEALFQNNISERPVFRLSDTPGVSAQIRQAIDLHGQGACLRLGSDIEDPDPNISMSEVFRAVEAVGVDITQVDLIVDFKVVDSAKDVARSVPVALSMLEWASDFDSWRSVTIASGAFVRTVSGFDPNGVSQLERYDAMLFNRIVQSEPAIKPDFGDYGINYPIFGPTPPRSPNPNLRYTDGLRWQIDREQRRLPGNNSFITICQRLVEAPYWQGSDFSAGDRELQLRADGNAGPGSATEWLAFGESHHFAHVVDRLATLGEP